jgi:hypothetical protein
MKMIVTRCLLVARALLVGGLCYSLAQQSGPVNDKDINVISYEDLDYPAIAVLAHVQGVVVVRLRLDDHGKVLGAEALSAASLLAGPSVDNVRKWRFEPNPEKAEVIVYNFRIEGACHYGGPHSQMIFYPPNLASITACGRPPMQ